MQALQNIDNRLSKLQPRQYLADRLLSISRQLGKYVRKDHWNANGIFYEEFYQLDWQLNKALVSTDKSGDLSTLEPAALGEVEAKLDYFWQCLEEFHNAEKPPLTATSEPSINQTDKQNTNQSASSKDRLIALHLELQERRARMAEMRRRRDEQAAEIKKNGWQSALQIPDLEARRSLTEKVWEALTHEPSGEPYTDDFKQHIRSGLCSISLFEIPAFLHTKFPFPDATDLAYLGDILTELREDCQQGIELELDDPEDERLLPLIGRCQQWITEQYFSKQANPTSGMSDLPPAVRKRLDYFPQLISQLLQGPLWNIDEVLNEALANYKIEESDLSQGVKFTSRLKHYCEQTAMNDAQRDRIMNWILWAREKENEALRFLEFPELRQPITEIDRNALLNRLESVKAGLGIMKRTGKIAEISKWEENIKLIESRLTELDAAKQMPSEAAQPSTNRLSNKPALVVMDLCLPPFTPTDLTTLLLYLKALPSTIPHRWSEPPRGKGKGAISKIAAALGVLSSDNLLRDDKEIWSEAIERDYGIRLGAKVLDYEYKSANGSFTFDTATEKSRSWVERWKLTVSDSY